MIVRYVKYIKYLISILYSLRTYSFVTLLCFRYLNFVARNVTEHSKRRRTLGVYDGPKHTARLLAKNWLWIHHLRLKRDVTYPWNMTESFGKCQVSKLCIIYIIMKQLHYIYNYIHLLNCLLYDEHILWLIKYNVLWLNSGSH